MEMLLNLQVWKMDDLVTSDSVFDDVSEIARDQMARGKAFMETLSKALDVQADYNVSQTF